MSVALFLAFTLATPPLPPGAVDRLGSPAFKHGGTVSALAFSPDGKRLATASSAEGGPTPAVKVWDAATGVLVMRAPFDAAALAWSADGRRLAAAGGGAVKLWDMGSGKEVLAVRGEKGATAGVAISPDGKLLASIQGPKRSIVFWDAATGKRVRELPARRARAGATGALVLAFTPDGRWLAAVVESGGLVFWDAATGAESHTIPGFHNPAQGVTSPLTFDAGGSVVALWSYGEIALHDSVSGRERQFIRGVRSTVWTPANAMMMNPQFGPSLDPPFAMSKDGGTLALVRGGDIHLWDVATDSKLRTVDLPLVAQRGPVALSPDGETLAYAHGSRVVVEDVRTGRRPFAAGSHAGPVAEVAFGRVGEAFTADRTLRAWDLGPKRERRGEAVPGCEWAWLLAPRGDACVITAASKVALVDPTTGDERGELPRPTRWWRRPVALTRDNRFVVAADDSDLALWDVRTGRRVAGFLGHGHPVEAASVSPDGTRLATSSDPQLIRAAADRDAAADRVVRVWNLATGEELFQVSGRGRSLAYSPDGKLLAVGAHPGSADPPLRFVDAATGAEVRRFSGLKFGPARLVFSPDGKTLAAGVGNEVRLWDAATGKELRRLEGHEGEVYSLAFSADGKRLITGGEEGLAYIWDLTAPR